MTAQEYLHEHGINEDTINKFNITWDEDSLSFPVFDISGKLLFNKVRYLKYGEDPAVTSKYNNPTGSHATLFNYHNVVDSPIVVLCEGELDAIRLTQENIPAVSTTAGTNTFKDEWVPLLLDKKIYICYDTDEPGKQGTIKLIDIFPDSKVITLPEPAKDVCEFFTFGTMPEFIELMKTAQTTAEWKSTNIPRGEEFDLITAKDFNDMEIEETPWLIDEILYSEGLCLLYGAEGTGKSYIALDMAHAIATGSDWLGKFKVSSPAPVLYLDKENPKPLIKKRLSGLGVTAQENLFWLKYPHKMKLSDGKTGVSSFARTIGEIVVERGIKLIIIDSFVDFIEGNESSSTDTQDFFNCIREIFPNVAYLALHHENKPTQGVSRNDSQRIRGSSNLAAQAFTAFRLEQVAKSKTDLTLKQTKARDSLRLEKFMFQMLVSHLEDSKTTVSGFRYMGEVPEGSDPIMEGVTEDGKLAKAKEIIINELNNNRFVSRKDMMNFLSVAGVREGTAKRAIDELHSERTVSSIAGCKANGLSVGKHLTLARPIVGHELFNGELDD
jgi:hypothetical protein